MGCVVKYNDDEKQVFTHRQDWVESYPQGAGYKIKFPFHIEGDNVRLTNREAIELTCELCWEVAKQYEHTNPNRYTALIEAMHELIWSKSE